MDIETKLLKMHVDEAIKLLESGMDYYNRDEFVSGNLTFTGQCATNFKCGAMSSCIQMALDQLQKIEFKED